MGVKDYAIYMKRFSRELVTSWILIGKKHSLSISPPSELWKQVDRSMKNQPDRGTRENIVGVCFVGDSLVASSTSGDNSFNVNPLESDNNNEVTNKNLNTSIGMGVNLDASRVDSKKLVTASLGEDIRISDVCGKGVLGHDEDFGIAVLFEGVDMNHQNLFF